MGMECVYELTTTIWYSYRQDHINKLKSSFQERLNVPHSDIDGTLSKLSSFMTKYANSEYESFMAQSSKKASKTRTTLERLSYFEEQLVTLRLTLP